MIQSQLGLRSQWPVGMVPHLGTTGAAGTLPDGQIGGGGDERNVLQRFLGLDPRLCWICAYAFLIAVNNTSLRPILPSFIKVRLETKYQSFWCQQSVCGGITH